MRYQIGDFSTISRLSIKTLRYYHEFGILEPTHIDEESGYRYYDEASLQRAAIISELKSLDFPLKDIKDILDRCNDDIDLVAVATTKYAEISSKITRYGEMQKRLDAFIKQTRQTAEDRMTHIDADIIIKEVPKMLVASIRFIGKYQDVGGPFAKLFKACGRHCSGSPMCLYYDNEYKDNDADIEVCVPIKVPVTAEEITCRTLEGGKAVAIIHKGPYDRLSESYKALIDHTTTAGLAIHGPCREIYLKGPGMIIPRNPKKFVTEIQMFLDNQVLCSTKKV
jgi:effector-binding domain-containing protein